MRLGLTGTSGVLGRRVAAACRAQGHEVVPSVGDIRDPDVAGRLVQGVDAVIHCAAVVPTVAVESDLARAISTNVGGASVVARAAAGAGVPLAYTSTSHVYKSSSRPIEEDGAVEPLSLYGLTKWQGEVWARRLHPEPLILRAFSFFDAAQPREYLVPSLYQRIAASRQDAAISIARAHSVRDIADATYIAEAVVALVTGGHTGVYNCATGRGHTVLDLARRLAEAMGRSDLRFESADDGADILVADVARLNSQAPHLGGFDLDRALLDFVTGRREAT